MLMPIRMFAQVQTSGKGRTFGVIEVSRNA